MMARVLILLLLLIVGCISPEETEPCDLCPADRVLDNGDFAKVELTGRISDTEEVFYTTREDVALDPEIKKAEEFKSAEEYEPLGFVLGQDQILPALEAGMIGMKIGHEKNITLAPEDAYGEWSSANTVSMPRVAVLLKLTDLPVSKLTAITGKEPELNETVNLSYWTAKVVDISGSDVTLLHEPDNNTLIETEYGPAVVTLNDTHVVTTLSPELGAVIKTAVDEGVISEVTETDFTVDFNHPLAGRTLVFEVKVEDIIKSGMMLMQRITWTDHESGLETAKNEKRPAVIFLYIEDCRSCESLEILTLSNPEVTELRDKFVWIKVDAGANPDIASEYDAKSYPTIVLLDGAGEVAKTVEGHITSADLRKELGALASTEKD